MKTRKPRQFEGKKDRTEKTDVLAVYNSRLVPVIPSNFPHKLKARHIAEGSSSPDIGVERPVLDAASARESIHESTAQLDKRAGAPARLKGVGR